MVCPSPKLVVKVFKTVATTIKVLSRANAEANNLPGLIKANAANDTAVIAIRRPSCFNTFAALLVTAICLVIKPIVIKSVSTTAKALIVAFIGIIDNISIAPAIISTAKANAKMCLVPLPASFAKLAANTKAIINPNITPPPLAIVFHFILAKINNGGINKLIAKAIATKPEAPVNPDLPMILPISIKAPKNPNITEADLTMFSPLILEIIFMAVAIRKRDTPIPANIAPIDAILSVPTLALSTAIINPVIAPNTDPITITA